MDHLKDTYRHQGKRKLLIEELKRMGIQKTAILDAFYQVPRHFFMDLALDDLAYTNAAFQIGSGQTISHPYTVAFQTELLEVQRKMKVLEIGTGSGFQTCILCALGTKVYSIERHEELHLKADAMVKHFKFDARLRYGDGFRGWPSYAPFDRIIVTCGAPEIPLELKKQLAIGGIMIIPVGEGVEQVMLKIVRLNENEFTQQQFGTFKFVPMLEQKVSIKTPKS
ncbi:MAG: protein-L-isoaspartate(D-aspartate) O-methyltransferase [Flavobacteriia bacterium]|jgi:protein-L-isoaspartate(D-aspartate) O-methyltransferase|nr:protein-L-isoaspartate(D-aspartate) O-methyltransferase [Flavobacteriia bacterium]NBP28119.1 protein-L-isoaspartate(D-aspartate) O-methyltransferase [Flavobacteriia bacterium]